MCVMSENMLHIDTTRLLMGTIPSYSIICLDASTYFGKPNGLGSYSSILFGVAIPGCVCKFTGEQTILIFPIFPILEWQFGDCSQLSETPI